MTSADDIFDQSSSNLSQLGLREIPFTESPTDLRSETLHRVFTGRQAELKQVFNLFQSRERRRILIYGRIGIGKSAFLLEVLSVLRRKRPKMLTTYISLPAGLDLATTALIAVAKEMADDEWAQRQLYQMGIPTSMMLKDRSAELGGNLLGLGGKLGEKDLPISQPQYPTVSLDTLLERAQKKYPEGIVIGIDDLDKQSPAMVRQLMHDAQGMLKGRAWFMLTGHPTGISQDLLTSERGLFDLQLPLTALDLPTTYEMLINYLNSARLDNDCTDPDDPRSVLPFEPETAADFCRVSMGRPRLFNRLGNAVLAKAADLGATVINSTVLAAGLRSAAPTLRQQAALTFQQEQVRQFLQQRGAISDEDIAMEDLLQLGLRSFTDLLPYLERLEEADLAYQIFTNTFAPIPLPAGEDEG